MRPLQFLINAIVLPGLSLCCAANVVAQSPGKVLYAFKASPDCGNSSDSPLIGDAAGNLYGATLLGGANNKGCIFELSRGENGWQERILHSFSGPDGNGPEGSLVFDKAGNLYGTTVEGGAYDSGTAFELSRSSDGNWTETVLHNFGSVGDGTAPECNLVFDRAGSLYGATSSGGTRSSPGGTVFKLSPGENGWTETILYSFPGSINGPDAADPVGGVVMDRAGRLYGVAGSGGAHGAGAVFELAPYEDGYREKVIFSFYVTDGLQPSSGLAIGPAGSLYGTTAYGGTASACPIVGCGVVFALSRKADGSWSEEVLHQMNGSDGTSPIGPVAFDSKGNLYSAAQFGGINNGGSVFMLTPVQSGPWTETMLHLFDFKFPNGKDGQQPYAGVSYGHGRVFGTTASGGVHDEGIVFEIMPPIADSRGTNPATPQQ